MRQTVAGFLLHGLIAPAVCLTGFCHYAAGADELAARVASYSISVALNPGDHTLSARETLNWRNATAYPATELQFHLYLNGFKNESTGRSATNWH